MAYKRLTFTLTTANGIATALFDGHLAGVATDDGSVQTPASPTRPVFLEAIAIDDSAALAPARSFSLYEGVEDSVGVITEGQVLVHIDDMSLATISPLEGEDGPTVVSSRSAIPVADFDSAGVATAGSVPMLHPRTNAGVVDENGVAVAGVYVRIPIRENDLIATIAGGAEGDVYKVYVYYETAGDWRF